MLHDKDAYKYGDILFWEDAGSRVTRTVLPLYRSGSVKQVILHIQFFIGELSSPDRKAVLSLRLRYKPTFSLGVFLYFIPGAHTYIRK